MRDLSVPPSDHGSNPRPVVGLAYDSQYPLPPRAQDAGGSGPGGQSPSAGSCLSGANHGPDRSRKTKRASKDSKGHVMKSVRKISVSPRREYVWHKSFDLKLPSDEWVIP